MIYPEHIVSKYRELVAAEAALDVVLGRNFYDKEAAVKRVQEEVDRLAWELQEEAAVYAAETGADRDGGYDPDRVMDDLETQLGGSYDERV